MKVWDRAGIQLATPGSAVRLASVARHVTDCATRPGQQHFLCHFGMFPGLSQNTLLKVRLTPANMCGSGYTLKKIRKIR